jgi:hypothetical protein
LADKFDFDREEVKSMRMKIVETIRAVARQIESLLEVRLRMDIVAGLRTR